MKSSGVALTADISSNVMQAEGKQVFAIVCQSRNLTTTDTGHCKSDFTNTVVEKIIIKDDIQVMQIKNEGTHHNKDVVTLKYPSHLGLTHNCLKVNLALVRLKHLFRKISESFRSQG